MEKVKPLLKRATVHYVPRLVPVKPSTAAALAGCRNLAELLSSGGSDLEFVDWGTVDSSGQNWQVRRLEQTKQIDLLYVSTNHQPNVQAFWWFYENVFLSHLAERHVNVVVAGNIHWSIPHDLHPQVFLAGRQDTLDPLYAATRLVIVPIQAAAGISIKTLAALAKAKPVVATSLAFRDVEFHGKPYPVHDSAEEFASQVISLLASQRDRARLAKQGYEIVRQANNQAKFDTAMNAAFKSALGDAALLPLRSEVGPGASPPPLAEWTEEIGRFNNAMRDFTEGLPLDPGLVAHVVSALSDRHSRKIFSELYQAFMVDRTAPILETASWVRSALEQNFKKAPSFDAFVSQLKAIVPEIKSVPSRRTKARPPATLSSLS